MSITIELPPTLEHSVRNEAKLRGISAEELLRKLVESNFATQSNDTPKRPYGLCAGEFQVPDDFNAPLPDDILDSFEGK